MKTVPISLSEYKRTLFANDRDTCAVCGRSRHQVDLDSNLEELSEEVDCDVRESSKGALSIDNRSETMCGDTEVPSQAPSDTREDDAFGLFQQTAFELPLPRVPGFLVLPSRTTVLNQIPVVEAARAAAAATQQAARLN